MTSTSNVLENLTIVETLIQEAVNSNAELIVLPEMFAIAGCDLKDKLKVQEKFKDGPIQEFLSNQAQKHKIWIVAGTIPISCENTKKVRAACIVYNSFGEVVGRYDKIHLFDVTLSATESYKESDNTEAGNQIVTVDSPFGRIGLTVCYDIRFPLLFHELAAKHVDIITVPAAFTLPTGKAHWEIMLRARAIENLTYVVGSAQTGKHANGRRTYGHSMIIEPWGEILAELCEDKPGVIYADVNLDYLKELRRKLPVLEHRKSLGIT